MMNLVLSATKLWDRAPGWCAAVYTTLLMMLMFAPVSEFDPTPPGYNCDKIIHLTSITLLYILWVKASVSYDWRDSAAVFICLLFSLFTEAVQAVIPYRSADLVDLVFDIAGIAIGVLMVRVYLNLSRTTEQSN